MEYFDSGIPRIPDYELSEKEFLLQTSIDQRHREHLIHELVEAIKKDSLAPYYEYLSKEITGFPFDLPLYENMKKQNQEKVEQVKQKIKEAEDEEETELDPFACYNDLAEYLAKICDKAEAEAAYNKAFEITKNNGTKIDILLAMCRIEFFFNDLEKLGSYLERANSLMDKGGDWERRNRFKTYNGVYLMATRNFLEAAHLLMDSLATFTSTELCSYEQVTQYAIVCGVVSLDRVNLKSKLIDSPEVLSSYSSSKILEPLINLTNVLYTSQNNYFFPYLLESYEKLLLPNKFLNPHANYFLREMRCKAYGQLLESYQSLSLRSMAQSFGISEEFLDQDLCKFIPNRKLNCTIDRVNGIIETNRPDSKNNQYHLLIKQGDGLLTKLQKYVAAVKLSGAERV